MKNTWGAIRRVSKALYALRQYIAIGRWGMATIGGLVGVATVLEVFSLGLLAELLNLVLGTGPAGARPVTLVLNLMPHATTVTLTVVFGVAVIVTTAIKNFAVYGKARILARTERDTVERLRAALFARLQAAPLEVHEEHASASLAALITSECERATSCFSGLVDLVQTAGTVVLLYVAMIWTSPVLAGVTLVGGVGLAIGVLQMYRHFARLGVSLTHETMAASRAAAEAFNGSRVVRATNAQQLMAARVAQASAKQAVVAESYKRETATLSPVVQTGSIAIAVMLLIGTYAFLVAPGVMSQAKLTAFGLILLRLMPMVQVFSGQQAHLLYLSGGATEVMRWLATPQFPVRPFGTHTFERIERAISVRELSYSYASGQPALQQVSFDVPVGWTVALVGRSGSGKTTLATLLMRMREASAGGVFVDDVDYWEFSPQSWLANVALVEQEPFLFNDTLGANVAFGFAGATDDDIEFAMHVAHLDDLLESLPDRLDTPIGERGVMLSGGQRQRLSIARAIVRNPRFLILDEATSNLDTVSEALVQAALESARRGRTTLVIAHRLSTVRRADRIVVLDGGRVVESGTWDELIAANGAFAELVRRGFTHDVDEEPGRGSAAPAESLS